LSRRTVRRNVAVSNAVGTQVIQINKRSEQIGKANRRGNIAEFFRLAGAFPLAISDCVNDVLPVIVMGVMFNLAPRLPRSVGVQEKVAFYRPF